MNDDSNYIATEASLVIAKGNIAVICTNDEVYPCYLLHLTCKPCITDSVITDTYNHTFQTCHRVVNGHYL